MSKTTNSEFPLRHFFESLTTVKAITLISLLGLIVYSNALFNGFVWDDLDFIINNPEVHQFNISSLLGPNMFNAGPFYRPMPAVYFAAVYSLFGENAFYYHAIQLLLHIISASLLFIFFRKFFTQGLAIFLALIFLVHPINVESVAYIGSTQSQLYFIPGILALILSKEKVLSRTKFFLIVGLLALSAFTKETGVLFFALVLAYRYLFALGQIVHFFTAGSLLAIIYLSIRIFILGKTYAISENISIASLSFIERILNIPSVFIYYLKTFFYPAQLIVWQQWVIKEITFQNFFLPLIVSGVFILFLLFSASQYFKSAMKDYENIKDNTHVKLKQNTRARSFLLFLFWFAIGMGLIIQLVPLDMTVADRWFYFPIVGLLGMMGVFMINIQNSLFYRSKIFFVFIVILFVLLSARTFVRTLDYKNNLTLYSRDLKEENSQNYMMMGMYAKELWLIGKKDESMDFLKRSLSIFPSASVQYNLGLIYENKNQYEKALKAYTLSIKLYENANGEIVKKGKAFPAYVRKLALLTSLKRSKQKIDFIQNTALKKYPDEHFLYYELALTAVETNDRQLALKAAKKAHELYPEDLSYSALYRELSNTSDWSHIIDKIRLR